MADDPKRPPPSILDLFTQEQRKMLERMHGAPDDLWKRYNEQIKKSMFPGALEAFEKWRMASTPPDFAKAVVEQEKASQQVLRALSASLVPVPPPPAPTEAEVAALRAEVEELKAWRDEKERGEAIAANPSWSRDDEEPS